VDLDLVIRGGTVVDGTGAPARVADVGIAGDRIVAVGEVDARGARELDATDRVVTPGFVDLHTHLDAQIAWDPMLTSSCWHGVTSVVLGNCGVTFAPVRPVDREYLAEMMESVEDIPKRSILDGLPWSWETYGEYLDALEAMPKGINVGGMVGHCAVRYHAMGDRSLSLEPGAPPTADDLAAMCALVDEAIAAGALGVSTSRTLRHRVPDGRYVPGTWAEPDELLAFAEVLAARGRGVFEVSPRFDGDGPSEPRVESELAWMSTIAERTGRSGTFNLSQTNAQGEHWRRAIELARAAGGRIRPQTTSKSVGVLFALASHTPFDRAPAWAELAGLGLDERLARLRDPAVRSRLTADPAPTEGYDEFFVVREPVRYDNAPGASLGAIARARGVSAVEAFIDLNLESEGRLVLALPFLNQRIDAIEAMLGEDVVVMGLADAGAHVGQVMDASQPTYFLTYWVRERGLLSIEEAVRRLSSDTADFMGIPDRGTLREGAFADVNIIDWDALALEVPEFAHDFPHGAGRWTQRGRGYDATIVNGSVVLEHGEHVGGFAGRVLRSGPDLRQR
jgi:N-acyl-D-aspartate/D-glutamate deacylase